MKKLLATLEQEDRRIRTDAEKLLSETKSNPLFLPAIHGDPRVQQETNRLQEALSRPSISHDDKAKLTGVRAGFLPATQIMGRIEGFALRNFESDSNLESVDFALARLQLYSDQRFEISRWQQDFIAACGN